MIPNILYTVGHSSRSVNALRDVLESVSVSRVVDVRSFPRSSRFPQFNRDSLTGFLGVLGIDYVWLGRELGGRRRASMSSPHGALDPGMRSYADHMGTATFRFAVQRLSEWAQEQTVAVLCAESRPDRCHRSFLCDYMVCVHDLKIVHLIDTGITEEHRVSRKLRWLGGQPVYDRLVNEPLFPQI